MSICFRCRLPGPHEGLMAGAMCIQAQEKAMATLLKNVGESGTCRGCNVPIFWVTHKNGKKTPYTPAGLNHHVDCPKAKDFSTK